MRTESEIAYDVAGSGPAVLLIHAGIADRRMWDPQWEAWRDRFTLVRYDLREIGESADPFEGYRLEDDARAVLDAAGCERAAVVGASFGGRVAIDLALDVPERVTALVAVASAPGGWEHTPDLAEAFAGVERAYEVGGLDAANEAEMRMWVDGPGREPGASDPAIRDFVAGMNRSVLAREEEREKAGTSLAPGQPPTPALERLGEIACPVMVVTGEHDQPSINAGSAVLAAATGAETAEIADSAHLPSLERPAEFDAAVLPFLAAQSSNSA